MKLTSERNERNTEEVRCGVVLAAGEGARLKPLVHRLRGYPLPKQYVNFMGARSMLEHTFRRAEKLIPPERLFTVVNRQHLEYAEARRQLRSRPTGTVVLQPENKETGPGLMLPLIYLLEWYPNAVITVFPSDHFVEEEDLFMGYVDLACRAVERDPFKLVLLGVVPDGPEPEYGYILPDGLGLPPHPSCTRRVLRFVEKPDASAARDLTDVGGLWNTMVMTFKARTMLDLVRRINPALSHAFSRIRRAIGTPSETTVMERTYRRMAAATFSKALLESIPLLYPSRLWVLPVRGVSWSDWGSERRIIRTLRETGHLGLLGET
jgi:mannose-1-phosphate guanylyltransferase